MILQNFQLGEKSVKIVLFYFKSILALCGMVRKSTGQNAFSGRHSKRKYNATGYMSSKSHSVESRWHGQKARRLQLEFLSSMGKRNPFGKTTGRKYGNGFFTDIRKVSGILILCRDKVRRSLKYQNTEAQSSRLC